MVALMDRPDGPLKNFLDFGFVEVIENIYSWQNWELINGGDGGVTLLRGDIGEEFRDLHEAWAYFITKY